MEPPRGRELSESRRATEPDQEPSRESLREYSAERTEQWLSSHIERQQQRTSPYETWGESVSTLPSTSASGRPLGRFESPRPGEARNRSADDGLSSSRYTFDSSTTFGDDSLSTLSSVRHPPESDITLPTGVFRPPAQPRAASAAQLDKSMFQGGFDANFVAPLDDKNKCSICLMALREPVQTDCGHRFCRTCIESIIQSRRPFCPLDNEPLSNLYPDNFCKREILSLFVTCQNDKNGCQWKGQLKDLEYHLAECDYTPIPCPNAFRGCTVELRRLNLPAHLEKECLFREASCPHCKEKLPVKELEAHINEACPQKEINCPNGCGFSVKRLNMPRHLAEECEKTVKACHYREQGCNFEGLISELNDHMEKSVQYHLDLVNEQSSKLTERLAHAEQTAKEAKKTVSILQAELTQTRTSLDVTIESQRTTEERLVSLESLVQARISQAPAAATNGASHERLLLVEKKADEAVQKAVRCEEVSRTLKQNVELNQAKVGVLEREVTKFNTIIARTDAIMAEFDLRLLSLETTSFSGVMVWKIPDYRRHFEEARTGRKPSLYSPPFFTSRHGYKMCARVYLNGDGVGKGTHVSIFFVVMKGEFDALLAWPFHQKVTLTLLDQSASKRHVADTFLPDPGSSSFQRPSSEMNIASGCPRFVSLDMLKHGTYSYIKDDTIFIRIAVDTTGLAGY